MCGQWSDSGYMRQQKESLSQEMKFSDWTRLVDELVEHRISAVLLRGGEVFLFPEIVKLLEYFNSKGIFTSIDTNGTLLKDFAKDLVRLGSIHLTFSIDGPEEIHDFVRGSKGCFNLLKENIALLHEHEKTSSHKIGKSITFTISPYSYRGLSKIPDIARGMGIDTITVVPYYYAPKNIGEQYQKELEENFSCQAFSWLGFQHETAEIDFTIFRDEYHEFLENLDGINVFPYMGSSKTNLTEDDYRVWFTDVQSPVGPIDCQNIEKFIDIQPNGNANFCTDFPDYSIGNVKESKIFDLWNSDRADRFREYRRKKQLAICYRCGAKYMSEVADKI